MNETLFTEYLDKKELHVTREFNAPVALVWRTWTEPELLTQWWAPKPWKAISKYMDFSEGGYWLYCMKGPNEGEEHWGRADYIKIVVNDFFDAKDSFCDEEGNVNNDLPGTEWHVTFTKTENGTKLTVVTTFASVEGMKQLIEMGVKEGTNGAHQNLDELLEKLLQD